jgi:hypothetical protein
MPKDANTGQKFIYCKIKDKLNLYLFFLRSLMIPLIKNPQFIPQIILSLCTVSIATCNKLFDIMKNNGDKIRPRLNVTASDETFSWLFNTGAAVTCMNSKSFYMSFSIQKPKMISKPERCVAASGDAMNSIGIFKVDL